MMELENPSSMTAFNSGSGEASVSCFGQLRPTPLPLVVVKKKRNLAGIQDPEAEVVARSPKTLLATNRFVCEVCSKGFPRDQNLELHRKGHHDPSRALGDLIGIKKHFCRKHGEKEVEVRQVLQEVRHAVRLEGPRQGLRHPRIPLRLRRPLLAEEKLHPP
ncbi:zinc finger protein GAI-ASSOCIATED FACTOR 1-like [Musa acuminata AAA Group]|uniref:zinc finger protein GAI-ASSOCIATED FACTOR 1-like n=1 Tax=Musa acuminata AAA Group TaxID=214697 RepID=UPI0031E14BA3